MTRLPDLPFESMDDLQQALFKRSGFASRGGEGRGPSHIWLFSPELADRIRTLGDHVRRGTSLEPRFRELAILVTARQWSAQHVWWVHAPQAAKHGLRPEVIDAIRKNRPPAFSDEKEAALYQFALEAHRDRKVATPTFERAMAHFGTKGIVELVGILGYYALGAMAVNIFEFEPATAQFDD